MVQTETVSNDDEAAKSMILSFIQRTEERQNSLEWQMDLTITTKNILMRAGGFYYDPKTKKVLKYKDSSLNSTGVLRLGEILDTYLNKDTISSNLSLREISRIMEPLITEIPLEFYKNREKYGIDMVRFPATMNMIWAAIFMALKRAYEDGTRKHNETFFKYFESITQKDKDSKKANKPLFAT